MTAGRLWVCEDCGWVWPLACFYDEAECDACGGTMTPGPDEKAPGSPAARPTPAERVAAGAAMLDQRIPGWHQEIKLHAFRIESARNCIIGQLGAGSYLAGTKRAYSGDEPMTTEEHGFIWSPSADDDRSDPEYAALEAAWREEIGRRRAQLAQEWAGFHERSGK